MSFKRKTVLGVLGMITGAAVAVGVPWVVFTRAESAGLSTGSTVMLALAGIGGGVILGAISIFLSIVTPSQRHD
jgi:hypothetical protein